MRFEVRPHGDEWNRHFLVVENVVTRIRVLVHKLELIAERDRESSREAGRSPGAVGPGTRARAAHAGAARRRAAVAQSNSITIVERAPGRQRTSLQTTR